MAVGPSHCDYWLQFTNFRTFGIAIDDPELLRGRTVAQNIALLALSNCAERGVGRRWRVVTLGPLMISWSWAPFVWNVSNVIHMCSCSFPCGQRCPCGAVATISAFVAQIPGVSDRMTRQNDISQRICSVSLPDSQDFASVPVVWTSHGKATDAHTISHAV